MNNFLSFLLFPHRCNILMYVPCGQAANYLKISSLLDLICHATVDLIKGKSPEEVRFMFHIKNDYTPEEEAEIETQNQWAFEWSGRCGTGACETSNMMIE